MANGEQIKALLKSYNDGIELETILRSKLNSEYLIYQTEYDINLSRLSKDQSWQKLT